MIPAKSNVKRRLRDIFPRFSSSSGDTIVGSAEPPPLLAGRSDGYSTIPERYNPPVPNSTEPVPDFYANHYALVPKAPALSANSTIFDAQITTEMLSHFLLWYIYWDIVENAGDAHKWYREIPHDTMVSWIRMGHELKKHAVVPLPSTCVPGLPRGLKKACKLLGLREEDVRKRLMRFSDRSAMCKTEMELDEIKSGGYLAMKKKLENDKLTASICRPIRGTFFENWREKILGQIHDYMTVVVEPGAKPERHWLTPPVSLAEKAYRDEVRKAFEALSSWRLVSPPDHIYQQAIPDAELSPPQNFQAAGTAVQSDLSPDQDAGASAHSCHREVAGQSVVEERRRSFVHDEAWKLNVMAQMSTMLDEVGQICQQQAHIAANSEEIQSQSPPMPRSTPVPASRPPTAARGHHDRLSDGMHNRQIPGLLVESRPPPNQEPLEWPTSPEEMLMYANYIKSTSSRPKKWAPSTVAAWNNEVRENRSCRAESSSSAAVPGHLSEEPANKKKTLRRMKRREREVHINAAPVQRSEVPQRVDSTQVSEIAATAQKPRAKAEAVLRQSSYYQDYSAPEVSPNPYMFTSLIGEVESFHQSYATHQANGIIDGANPSTSMAILTSSGVPHLVPERSSSIQTSPEAGIDLRTLSSGSLGEVPHYDLLPGSARPRTPDISNSSCEGLFAIPLSSRRPYPSKVPQDERDQIPLSPVPTGCTSATPKPWSRYRPPSPLPNNGKRDKPGGREGFKDRIEKPRLGVPSHLLHRSSSIASSRGDESTYETPPTSPHLSHGEIAQWESVSRSTCPPPSSQSIPQSPVLLSPIDMQQYQFPGGWRDDYSIRGERSTQTLRPHTSPMKEPIGFLVAAVTNALLTSQIAVGDWEIDYVEELDSWLQRAKQEEKEAKKRNGSSGFQ